ncbi:protein AAR2 homolog isoform X2 [Physella acuta]|nr:protein AAR2 homolog isoform X2 [Physella acuta]XP_059143985.1 protein AAR2 homolog isoform X2 [Physella acuta]XP_059143986.1 protein AAR2 homolog isoform X2 [Physella acuta]XP_059143987.1 protein AAR2 homolog isoform X2 [Physella acuta]XP_059143989.1 protein AAR2 homolog isoform X2 [Physella acuta]XP_059143990.1 protein AAR2 homolog isoform X2 [Physella acuta]XP_059143991.1 protein AAR2 homolog isoform X2 [Physella acuta]XP_059143992.1 protein AAR2 homolog isoform X2 [Physella acuta]
MDQEKAKVLFEHGAVFLLIDFPEGYEFGIDYTSWNVGPNFRGVKMIPAGTHFIYYSAINSLGQTSPRCGFYYHFSPKEIVVRKWDAKSEDIIAVTMSEDELQRYEINKQELDKFLGPYPYDKYKQWISLTNHISQDIIQLLEPDSKTIYSCDQFESETSTTQSRLAADALALEQMEISTPVKTSKLPKLINVKGTKVKYVALPKQRYPHGSTPAEITKFSLDSSYILELLLAERFNSNINNLLGEVQFAFICFIIGQNYDSFEQWKKLVHLLCTSSDAIVKYPDGYLSFITMIYFQIREIPSDFFVDIVTSNNFLTSTLHEFFQNLLSESVNASLKTKGLKFQKHLTERFHWDFSSEPDEYAPVVFDS